MFTHLHEYREGKVLYIEKKKKNPLQVQASVPFAATVYMCRKKNKFAVLNPAVLWNNKILMMPWGNK